MLVAYNPEIDWETEEIKITRCLTICKQNNNKKWKIFKKGNKKKQRKKEFRKLGVEEEIEILRVFKEKKKEAEKEVEVNNIKNIVFIRFYK